MSSTCAHCLLGKVSLPLPPGSESLHPLAYFSVLPCKIGSDFVPQRCNLPAGGDPSGEAQEAF